MRFTLSPGVLEAARAGGPGLDSLLREVWPQAYRVALGIVRDPGLAEDTAQDACASITRGLSTLRSGDAFYVWMHRIIVRHARLAVERRPKTQALATEIETGSPGPDAARIDLLDALASLPQVQRAAVVLRYYGGFNSSEIASMTGLPAPTVRFHLMLARRALRAKLRLADAGLHSKPEVYSNVQ